MVVEVFAYLLRQILPTTPPVAVPIRRVRRMLWQLGLQPAATGKLCGIAERFLDAQELVELGNALGS